MGHLQRSDIAALAAAPAGGVDDPARNHLDSCLECAAVYAEVVGGARTLQGVTQVPGNVTRPSLPPHPVEPPAKIGRYLVLGTIAEGGMGSVVAAYDPELDRKVALKLVRFDLAGGERGAMLQERLHTEAQVMAQLSHPNVVQVFDVGTHQDGLYIAMEWVNGETLRVWQAKPHPWQEILARYRDAGRGLVAAHRAGLIHRDFKPDNVLIDLQGQVRVTDFGLARRELPSEGDPNKRTVPGEVLGTPGYMPAEQLRGETFDARADQFAFCVSLYEALYGRRPFEEGSFVEHAKAVVEGHVLPPPVKTDVPAYLWPLLRRGMEKRCEDRFPDMVSLLEPLGRDPAVRRRRVASGIALLLLAGAGVAWEAQRVIHERRRCGELAASQVAFWNPAAREAMSQAFLATGKSFAPDNLQRVTATIDQEVHSWVHDQAAWCEAAKTHPPDRAAWRLGEELQRRRDALLAAVEVFSSAGVEDVTHALLATESIRAGARGAVSREPPAANGDSNTRVDLARADFLWRDQKLDEALRYATSATARAAASSDGASEARGLYLQAQIVLDQSSDVVRAEELLKRANRRGEAAGADETVALARTVLMEVISADPKRMGEVPDAIASAESAVARLGDPPALQADLLNQVAEYYSLNGQTEAAREALRRSTKLFRDFGGERGLGMAHSLYDTAALEGRLGNWLPAIAAIRESLDIYLEIEGAHHPDVAHPMILLAQLLGETRKDSDALDLKKQGLAIFAEAEGMRGVNYGWALSSVAESELELERWEDARAHATAALSILEDHQLGHLSHIVEVLKTLASTDLKQGRRADALAHAERAYALGAQMPGIPIVESKVQFILSQALWPDPEQRERAVKLAQDSLKLMPASERHYPDVQAWVARIDPQRSAE